MSFKNQKLFSALKCVFVVIFCVSFISALHAQDEPTTYRIIDISVIGNKMYDKKTIISYSGLYVSQEIAIPSDETREAIKRLWNLNLFSDIQLSVDKKIGKDVYLAITVAELPRIEKIEITGNDKMSENDLKDKITLTPGQVVSEQKLKDIEYYLTKYYNDEGYSMAEVHVDQLLNANNEARIRVKVIEGTKVTVRKIEFTGNKNIKSDKLRKSMDNISEKVWWKFWDGARFDKIKFDQDKKLIIDYYKEFGYKDAEITDVNLVTSNDKEDMTIKIKVDEGPQYKINNVDFEGNKIYKDSILIAKLDFKKGDIYNFKKLNKNLYGSGGETENDIQSLYMDNGYLGVNIDPEEKDIGNNYLDLNIKIVENNQFRLGLISFEGNDKTKDKVMRRELYTIPGEYFNRTNVKRSMQQLIALNYFNPEKLVPDISLKNDSTVNIKYVVQERSSDQFNASVGYSGSYGITGSLGLTFNNFDIAHPLTGGAGQSLNFNWQFGEGGNYRTFSIGYTEPWLFDSPTLLGFSVYDSRQSFSYDVRETGAIVNLGRRFKWPDDYFRGDWSVKYQKTDVINGDNFYQTGVRDQFSVSQVITRSTVFDPVFPVTGTKIFNATELSGGPLLPGNIEFIKNTFSAETYTPLIRGEKLVLYSSFEFSFINPFGKDKYLPPTEYFFMGGNGLTYKTIALRGYDDRNIGPKSSSLNPIGGKVALKYSAEIRYPISLDPFPIFVLAFAEAGNIWSEFKKADPFDLRRSVGFGVRLQLPAVGIVGFDFGYGFDRQLEDRQAPKLLFHFQFGRGF
jgi:outer membrane protein insertion porin family